MKLSLTIQLILLPDLLPCDTHTHTHTHTHKHTNTHTNTHTVSSQTQVLLQSTRFFPLLYIIIFIIYFQGFIAVNSYIMSMYIVFCTSNKKQINAFLTMIFWAYYIHFSYEFSIMFYPYCTNPRLYIQIYYFHHESLIVKEEFREILSIIIL